MNSKTYKSMRIGLLSAVCCIALAGCGNKGREAFFHVPTQMSQNEIRVNQDQVSVELDAANVTREDINKLADDYMENGVSRMIVRVTYDRGGDDKRAEVALNQVKQINKMLKHNGVENAKVVIMPVDEAYGRALVSYMVLEALPPEGCGLMPGMSGAHAGKSYIEDYRVGCDTRMMMSRQIARPKDLLGNDASDGFDAQREGILHENGYRSGEEMPWMEGVSTGN